MARGGGVIFKKTNGNSGGRKRKARSNDDGDDEEDEEYVLGEDEEVEESESDYESDVNSRDLCDEESFEFSDEDEDGEEFKIARSKKKKQRNPKKSRVSDDEMEDLNLSVPKKRGRGRQRKQESRDSDFELDDEDDDDEDFSPDEDDFDEDEVSIFSKRKVGVKNVGTKRRSKVSKRKGTTKRSKVSVPARKRRKTMIEGSDDDFIVKGRVSVEREQTVSKKGRKKKSDSDSMDSDFVISDDDFVEKDLVAINKRRKNSNKVKKTVRSKGQRKKRSVEDSEPSDSDFVLSDGDGDDEDDDLYMKNQVILDKQQKEGNKVKKTAVSKGMRKKIALEDSEPTDSDFVISDDNEDGDDDDDDDDVKDQFMLEKQQKKSNQVILDKQQKKSNKVKKTAGSKGRRKIAIEDSEQSDSYFVISDDYYEDGDDDEDVKDQFMLEKQQKKSNQVILDKQQKKSNKVKKTAGSKGRRKIALEDSEQSDSDFVISDDDYEDGDDDEDVKDQFMLEKQQKKSNQVILDKQQKKSNKVKKTAGSKGRRKIALEDSQQSDSDFVISDDDYEDGDDDEDVKDQFMLEKQQKKSNKVKKTVGSRGRKKRSVEDSKSSDFDFMISDDDDDGFDVKDQVVVYKQQVNNKKEKAVSFNKGRRRKRSSSDLGSSDSDYLISEEDDEYVLKDQVVLDELRKNSKKVRKRRTEPMGRRRSSTLVDSDSESFDYDDVISEEEVRDLRIGWHSNHEQPKRITAGKKEEEKGNEKKAKSDSGKQVCGICLSEEKKSVVQGLLNCCFHYFCFACIMEWSKVESRCPVCKRRFETITKSGSLEPGFRMRGAVIRIQKRDQVYQPSEEELRGMLDPYEHVVCMECQQGRDDNLMLLCDICDSSAHTYCVGLGREVPDGNWFCECCRSVSDGQDQMSGVAVPDQEASQLTSARVSTNSPRPASMFGRSSSLRIDLNSSPRDFPGEEFVSSPISGTGASTVSGRRHIRQRIHVILSTNRQRQTSAGTNTFSSNSASDIAQNGDALPISDTRYPLSSVSSFEQWQQNPRPFFHSHPNLAPCMFTEGSSLRHVDGAKEEVQHMVKSHLKNLSRNRILERSAFEEIARKSTHTVLAACGIEHQRSMVSASVEPPDNCTHDSDDGPAHLLKGCCSSCFSFFVKDVVQRLVHTAAS